MKILVISDSHGDTVGISEVVAAHADAELLIFLGDGLRDLERAQSKFPYTLAVVAATGNCDSFSLVSLSHRETVELVLEGKKIFACHGHRYCVKGGIETITAAARAREADILLFGHTHIPYQATDTQSSRELHIMNPGSIGGRSSDGRAHYGIIEIKNGHVTATLAVLP